MRKIYQWGFEGVSFPAEKISKALLAVLLGESVMRRRPLSDRFSLSMRAGGESQRVNFDYIHSVEFIESGQSSQSALKLALQRRIRVVLGVDIPDWFKEAILLVHPDARPVVIGCICFYPYEIDARLKGALPDLPDMVGLKEAVSVIHHITHTNVTRWTNTLLREELCRMYPSLQIAPDGGAVLLSELELLGIVLPSGAGSWVANIGGMTFQERFWDEL